MTIISRHRRSTTESIYCSKASLILFVVAISSIVYLQVAQTSLSSILYRQSLTTSSESSSIATVALIGGSSNEADGATLERQEKDGHEKMKKPDGSSCTLTGKDQIPEVLRTCQTITSSSENDALIDGVLAFFPEWKLRNNTENNEDTRRHLEKDPSLSWLSDYWRKRQAIQWPNPPKECPSDTIGRFVNYFLGSQIFTDMRWMLYTKRPYHRHLDITNNVYMQNLETPPSTESKAMSELRQCLVTASSKKNAISCILLPTTDCLYPFERLAKNMTQAPNTQVPNEIQPKERALCPDDDSQKYASCVEDQVAFPIPTEPLLQDALAPDVSKMALFMFEREMALAHPLRKAVEEVVSATTIQMPCVAVHVRRGDKLPECGNGKAASCAFQKNWTEYKVPALNLLQQLPNAKEGGTLFVMTDDAEFLKHQATVDSPHQVQGLAGSTAPDLKEADGLHDLVILLASIHVASQCQAAVGNSESEVFEVLVLWNCIQRGACPSVHSMNGRATQAFSSYIVDGRASSVRIPTRPRQKQEKP